MTGFLHHPSKLDCHVITINANRGLKAPLDPSPTPMHHTNKTRPLITPTHKTGIIYTEDTYLIFYVSERHNTTTSILLP